LSAGLLRLATGGDLPPLVPVLVDQTAVGEIQVLTASYPAAGRAIPLAMETFEHGELEKSQNLLEEAFLRRLAGAVPQGARLVSIMDRGYARAALLLVYRQEGWLFIIRGRAQVMVEYGSGRRVSLGRLPHRQGKPCRYRGAFYQGREKEPVDIIVYGSSPD